MAHRLRLSKEESAALAYILARTRAVVRSKVAPSIYERLLAHRLIQSTDGLVTITVDGVLALNRAIGSSVRVSKGIGRMTGQTPWREVVANAKLAKALAPACPISARFNRIVLSTEKAVARSRELAKATAAITYANCLSMARTRMRC